MFFSSKAEAGILNAEAVILNAEGTVYKELVGLKVKNSAEVKKYHLFLPFFYLYLIAGRSCYLAVRSNCK